MPRRRWGIAVAGTLLQVCLGTVYAWSYFQKPVVEVFQCSQSRAAWAFSLAIGSLGLAAAWGGMNLSRYGPVRLAVSGGLLYGLGHLLASWALSVRSLALFQLGFGIIGGIGLGLGYVTPVATVAKWFPDKKGLVTGLVVMGFGLGALVMSKALAPFLMNRFDGRLDQVFAAMGVIILVGSSLAAVCLRNPPTPSSASENKAGAVPSWDSAHGEALRTIKSKALVLLWIMFFCNITAGLMFIGFQSPMIQELLQAQKPGLTAAELAGAGATLIGLSALCNALGRLFWGGLSDRIGRARTFRILLATQVLVFLGLPWVKSPWGFGFLVCYVLLCYGGGFGTMPSLVVDRFGLRLMPMVYGGLLTAWSIAGVVGPQLAALIRDHYPGQAMRLTFGAAALLLSLGLAATASPGFDGSPKTTDGDPGSDPDSDSAG